MESQWANWTPSEQNTEIKSFKEKILYCNFI